MKNPIDIHIEIAPECHDPVILIRTDQKTQMVEDIVHAIEACTDSSYPLIAGYRDSEMELLSQRDIIRVYVETRRVRIRTSSPPPWCMRCSTPFSLCPGNAAGRTNEKP